MCGFVSASWGFVGEHLGGWVHGKRRAGGILVGVSMIANPALSLIDGNFIKANIYVFITVLYKVS